MIQNTPPQNRPNIIWISLEDTSPRLGCYGDEVAHTPNLDRLANEGRRYDNAFSTAGVCAPSRSAILMGMYQTAMGTQHQRTWFTSKHIPELPTPYEAVPPHYAKTFTEYLRSAGYYCTNNEKTDYQFEPPITAWDECGPDAHWRHRDDGQPFFAVFNPMTTHESGMWPDDGPPNSAIGVPKTDSTDVEMPPYLPATQKARTALARHYDNLETSDQRVGDLLGQLEDDGVVENTVVFIWSDHGEGLPRAKRWLYDAGIRVPLIVRWPGEIDGGEVYDRLVSTIDLGPTVLSLAGVDVPAWMQGQPFLASEATEAREYVFAARDRLDESYDMVRAVRDDRYKYIRNYCPNQPYIQWLPYRNRHPAMQELLRLHAENELDGPKKRLFEKRPAEELYDTHVDPHEINNLANDPTHRDILERLRTTLNGWIDQIGDTGKTPEKQLVHERWPSGEQPQTATPTFVPNAPRNRGREPAPDGGTFDVPMTVSIYCSTQGASIAYTTDEGGGPHWQLYATPLQFDGGEITLRAKAIRYGYEESNECEATFSVRFSIDS